MYNLGIGSVRHLRYPRLIGRWIKYSSAVAVCALVLPGCTLTSLWPRQTVVDPEITSKELLGHIQYLASDERGGRFPGTAGSRASAAYITNQWKTAGLTPPDAFPDFRQTFDLISGVSAGEGCALLVGGEKLVSGRDFVPLGFSSHGSFSGGVVYAGWGLEDDSSTAGTQNLSGQWLMVFQPLRTAGTGAHGSQRATLIHQALLAKDAGATGIIVMASPAADTLIAMRYDRSFHDAGLAAVSITAGAGANILAALGITASEAWAALEAGVKVAPVSVPELEISAEVVLEYSISKIGNLISYLPGNDPALRKQYIVIGAHYDHLGYGGPGSGSLAPREQAVHNGADDNATGVAAVLELAEKFSAERATLKRSILFVAFDAEEQGLLGSKYFVEHSPVPVDSIILMINLDMIGRLRDKRLMVGGTGTAPAFERVLQEFNRKYQLDLQISAEGPGPSDHSVFYGQDIPVLFLFTGAHEDYHKPSDDWQKIDTAGVRVVAQLAYDLANYFNQRDERPEFTTAGLAADSPTRRSFRVTFGIMPGYGAAVEGLAVDGVREGGPAEKAGMQKGDVIIAINGKEVRNIRDYMFRLGELNPGDTVDVQILRAGEVASLTLQL